MCRTRRTRHCRLSVLFCSFEAFGFVTNLRCETPLCRFNSDATRSSLILNEVCLEGEPRAAFVRAAQEHGISRAVLGVLSRNDAVEAGERGRLDRSRRRPAEYLF